MPAVVAEMAAAIVASVKVAIFFSHSRFLSAVRLSKKIDVTSNHCFLTMSVALTDGAARLFQSA